MLSASEIPQQAGPQEPDSVLYELNLRISYCDSMAADCMNKIIQIPEEKKLKELSQQARDWSIRRDCFIESKQVYLLKKEKKNVK
jgi:hypothetical protein